MGLRCWVCSSGLTLPSGAPANDERVTATILHGHGLMPAMGNTMNQQDIDDLLAYLHTL